MGCLSPSVPVGKVVRLPVPLGIRWALAWEKSVCVRRRKESDSLGYVLVGCWGALPLGGFLSTTHQGSCWSQRPTSGPGIISGNGGARQEDFFSQMLAKACSGWGAFIACWRSTQVSPESSSAQWPEEFIPVGSGTKRDVSSRNFLSGQPLCVLKMPPHLVFPSPLLLTHHTSHKHT